jgi:hypothetical protein
MAQAERERASERTKRALERLRAEGRVYTKPTLIHWLALFRSGKKSFRELTREDIEDAERYFVENYVKLYLEGWKIRQLHIKFLQREKALVQMIQARRLEDAEYRRKRGEPVPEKPNTYVSYYTFRKALKKLAQKYATGAKK